MPAPTVVCPSPQRPAGQVIGCSPHGLQSPPSHLVNCADHTMDWVCLQ